MQSQGSKLNRTKEKRKLCAHLAGWFRFVAVEFENLETLLHTGSQFVLKALADAPLKHLHHKMSKEMKRESVCVCVRMEIRTRHTHAHIQIRVSTNVCHRQQRRES